MKRSVVLARVTPGKAEYWVDKTHFLCHHDGQTYGIPLMELFQSQGPVVFRPIGVKRKRLEKGKEHVKDEPPRQRARTPEDVAKELLLELPPELAVQILVQVPGVMTPSPAMRRWLLMHIHQGTLLAQIMGDPEIAQVWWRKVLQEEPPPHLLRRAGRSSLAYVRWWYPIFVRAYAVPALIKLYQQHDFLAAMTDKRASFRTGYEGSPTEGMPIHALFYWVVESLVTHLRPTPILAYSVKQRMAFEDVLYETQQMMNAFRGTPDDLRDVFHSIARDVHSIARDVHRIVRGVHRIVRGVHRLSVKNEERLVESSFEALRIIRGVGQSFSATDYLTLLWLVEFTTVSVFRPFGELESRETQVSKWIQDTRFEYELWPGEVSSYSWGEQLFEERGTFIRGHRAAIVRVIDLIRYYAQSKGLDPWWK